MVHLTTRNNCVFLREFLLDILAILLKRNLFRDRASINFDFPEIRMREHVFTIMFILSQNMINGSIII